ncbi:hypothetical protein RHOM_04895 [Roseburia hominis A2-183]|uniref:Uncharacterized protein n=1 Tax=Roseburia hominis (strain DSM 16839 / JCM 17582 / NCIMB 14029 / A2-183) TaxID=585394 RepID=G2T130_ROSHA|nr:hypothetical protein RHOM_04895 [Roseburia hominis A2-183]
MKKEARVEPQREHDRMNGQMGRWSNARGTGREIQARRTA